MDKLISQREAAVKIGVSDRWVRKLLSRMKKQDAVVLHGLRGRASNRKVGRATQERATELLKQPDRHDFGPTFASEQLTKRHGIGGRRDRAPMDDRRRIAEAGHTAR